MSKYAPGERKRNDPPRGVDIWNYFAPGLYSLGLLTDLDIFTFAQYCEALSLWLRTAATIRDHGPIRAVVDQDGKPASYEDRPEVVRFLKLTETVNRLGSRFGLDPSSRAALDLPQGDQRPTGDALNQGLR